MPRRKGLGGVRDLIKSKPWSALSWSSGILALAFISFYGILSLGNDIGIIGAQFVLSEWPDPKISPYFYAKPITWFSYLGFLYWSFGLESNRARLASLSEKTRKFIFVVTALVAFGAFYEIFFNFMLWSAFEVLCNNARPPCSPDNLINPFPYLRNPVNLVFATKVVTMAFALAIYSLWFLYRLEKDVDRQHQIPPAVSSRQDTLELDRLKITRSLPRIESEANYSDIRSDIESRS